MKRIVCFGANSDIAKALLRKLAELEPSEFFLFGRQIEELERQKNDLIVLGAKEVQCYRFDAEMKSGQNIFHNMSIDECFSVFDNADYVVLAHGYLPSKVFNDLSEAERTFYVNCLSFIYIIEKTVELFKRQGFGKLISITSVAADRGRKKLGYYAAAKAAVDSFLSAIRQSVAEYPDISIITVKPGFIVTKMTSHIRGPFPSTPEFVAKDIVSAILKNKQVVYTPWFWRYIMLAIKLVPESLFRKMNF
ncbi:MAG: SDR family NAD(P)-dependent oxidoreductase [Deltaproteobacteria bacterium]|nr:SDR family NAD(P)-dependent oxidoreductase [Deltaproteobacteria bacterium]